MKHIIFHVLLGVIFCFSCQPSTQYDSFGALIEEDGPESVNVLNELDWESQDSLNMKVRGEITEVCQMKGCWMKLDNDEGTPIRVTFRDYGFFVPKDAAGKEVIIEGTVTKTELAPEVAMHYAEDSGEEYDSTRTYIEYAFVADGVLIAAADQE
jgi:hypothetical protein